MFDMGFTEMMLIGIVALIVIGPERLPGVARTAGKYFGRLKRFMTTVKADVEQELRADELREILARQQQELNSLKDTISDAGREIEQEANALSDAGEAVVQTVAETSAGDSVAETVAESSAGDPVAETASAPPAEEAEDKARAKS